MGSRKKSQDTQNNGCFCVFCASLRPIHFRIRSPSRGLLSRCRDRTPRRWLGAVGRIAKAVSFADCECGTCACRPRMRPMGSTEDAAKCYRALGRILARVPKNREHAPTPMRLRRAGNLSTVGGELKKSRPDPGTFESLPMRQRVTAPHHGGADGF